MFSKSLILVDNFGQNECFTLKIILPYKNMGMVSLIVNKFNGICRLEIHISHFVYNTLYTIIGIQSVSHWVRQLFWKYNF